LAARNATKNYTAFWAASRTFHNPSFCFAKK
jgi:hypothetical protein